MTITQELVYTLLPAFRTPGPEVYNKLLPFIDEQLARWEQTIDLNRATDTLKEKIQKAAIHRAAYNAVPHLDLILTPTGFGIVSNQTTAPASRERVEALREQLRHTASIHEDILITQAVREQAFLHGGITYVDTLLWHPSLLTAYGITTPEGRQIYYEEYQALIPTIQTAQDHIATHTTSPELMAQLISRQYDGDTKGITPTQVGILDHITHLTRQAIAATITHQPPQRITDLRRQILDYIRLQIGYIPAYAKSRTRQAHDHAHYQNAQSDPSFFFA